MVQFPPEWTPEQQMAYMQQQMAQTAQPQLQPVPATPAAAPVMPQPAMAAPQSMVVADDDVIEVEDPNVPIGKYDGEVSYKMDRTANGKDGETYTWLVFQFQILEGPQKGRVVTESFSPKYSTALSSLVNAAGGSFTQNGAKQGFSRRSIDGKKVSFEVQQDKRDDRYTRLSNFKPIGGNGVTAAAQPVAAAPVPAPNPAQTFAGPPAGWTAPTQ